METGMLYLGVDQSENHSAFAFVNMEAEVVRVLPVILAGVYGGERLHRIEEAFLTFIKGVDQIRGAIEGFSVGSTNRPFDLGEVSGTIRAAYYRTYRQEFKVVPPCNLKKFACNLSHAPKAVILSSVKSNWGYETSDDNIADAVVLAQMARAFHLNKYTHRYQREALATLDVPKPKKLLPPRSKDNL
jgi:crossover junction endodeoxyribonuclease RuvC